MKYSVVLPLVLGGVWVSWSGHFTALLLGFGAGSCVLVYAISTRMNIVDQEGVSPGLPLRAFSYVPWLVWQIAKANVDVARRILDPRLPISPRLIRVKTGQKRDLGRVIYANSITLTPGTVSVDTSGTVITVHALSEEAANEVEAGDMDRRVTRLEGLV